MPSERVIRLTCDTWGQAKLWHGRLGIFLKPDQIPPRVIHHDTRFVVRWWNSKRFEFLQEVDAAGRPIGPRLL